MMIRSFGCCLLLAVLGTAVAAQTPASISLQPPNGTVISRHIYGHFAEVLGRCIYDGFWVDPALPVAKKDRLRLDIVAALKKIRVPNLRWPGGCYADQYHWRDGIGTMRPRTVNTTWGMVTDDNSFGTHEFLELCQLIGCDPYVAGNVGTGSPQEMKDWVEYLNFGGESTLSALRATNGHPEPYHVPFWGVGNESWGCGGLMTPETYATLYRTFAVFAKSYPGSPLKRIAGGANGDDYNWTDVCMKNIPLRFMWGLSFHYYTRDLEDSIHNSATRFTEAEYAHKMGQALHIEDLVNKHGAIMDKYDPQKKVAMVIDEWGIWVDAEPGTNPRFLYQQNSLRDALIAASTLNVFNNHADRIKMANLAQTVNVIQALILTKGEKMLLTPTYHVFDLYQVHQDAQLIPLHLESPWYVVGKDSMPAVNASASLDSMGRMHISLVNLDPHRRIDLTIDLGQGKTYAVGSARILTSEAVTDVNTFEQPTHVGLHDFKGAAVAKGQLNISLPSQSVVVVELQ